MGFGIWDFRNSFWEKSLYPAQGPSLLAGYKGSSICGAGVLRHFCIKLGPRARYRGSLPSKSNNSSENSLLQLTLCYSDHNFLFNWLCWDEYSTLFTLNFYDFQTSRTTQATMSDVAPALLIILITILVPPIGVFIVSGCSMDLFINICLTILGYIPGHIHAFYVEYVYFDRRKQSRLGQLTAARAPGIYSDRVQNGGRAVYGTM